MYYRPWQPLSMIDALTLSPIIVFTVHRNYRFFFVLATLSYFHVLPSSSIPPFSPHVRSHSCAHHMRSYVATTPSGSPFRRQCTTLSSVGPIASLSSTFSNYPCHSAVKHSSFFAPCTLSLLRPSHALLRGNNSEWVTVPETVYDILVRQPNRISVIDLQQLSMSFHHQAFLLFRPVYALTLAPIICALAWQQLGVGHRSRDGVRCSHPSAQSRLCHQPSATIHVLRW